MVLFKVCNKFIDFGFGWVVLVIVWMAFKGSFEESVLNGRLEPVSTVHGFKAELGASGAFVPKHLVVPVTVFFYTLGDNDKFSSPYLVST